MDKQSSQTVISTLQALQNTMVDTQATILNIQKFMAQKLKEEEELEQKNISKKPKE